MHRGFVYALSSSLLWSLVPIFLKTLHTIPALELLAYRVLWSLICIMAVLLIQRGIPALLHTLRCPQALLRLTFSAVLLALNWLLYLWAVNTNQIVESSLGYFIAPLITILFGAFFLKEQLSLGQKGAGALALGGVLILSIETGRIPWLGLALAVVFGGYALLHKATAVAAAEGLTIELLVLGIPALLYLLFVEKYGTAMADHLGPVTALQIVLTGLFTTGPLLLYLAGVQHLSLITLGLLQYLTPTLQLFFGVFFYHEAFPMQRLMGFGLIWVALFWGLLIGFRQATHRLRQSGEAAYENQALMGNS